MFFDIIRPKILIFLSVNISVFLKRILHLSQTATFEFIDIENLIQVVLFIKIVLYL